MKKIILLLTSIISVLIVNGQQVNNFFSKVKIQQTIDPNPKKPAPATFQFTAPKDGVNSWLADAAIGYSIETAPRAKKPHKGEEIWGIIPLFEYHRNTLIEKQQNNWQTGIAFTYLNANRTPSQNTTISHSLGLGLKYSRNITDTISSFLMTGSYDFFRSGHGLNFNTFTYAGPTVSFLSVTPSFEWQYNFDANRSTTAGTIFRPQATIIYEIGSALKKETSDGNKKISLTFAYTARYDAANSIGIREYYTQYFKAGFDIFLINDPLRVSIGTSFNYGSDPAKGLKQQQFWLLGLKVQSK